MISKCHIFVTDHMTLSQLWSHDHISYWKIVEGPESIMLYSIYIIYIDSKVNT